MSEPDFVYQIGEKLTPEERVAWWRKCAAEAREKGAEAGRASYHPDIPDLILFESWLDKNAKQEAPRWQLTLHHPEGRAEA